MEIVDILILFIVNAIIAGIIAVPIGYFHEYLHIRKAKQLGYKVVNRQGNELTIDVKDEKHTKQISKAPYIIIIPISIIILIIGIVGIYQDLLMGPIGLVVGAGGTILIHCISYPLEGMDEKKSLYKSKSD